MLSAKLFLIRGNHDWLSKTFSKIYNVILLIDPIQAELGNHVKLAFLHFQIVTLEDGLINLHGQIHNNPPPEGSTLWHNHFTMSVEVRDYRPCRFREIAKYLE